MIQPWILWSAGVSVLIGLGIWLIYGTVTQPRAIRRAQYVETNSLRSRYEQQALLLPWSKFMAQGALRGGLFAVVLGAATGNTFVMPIFFVFGFVHLFCAEEVRRDQARMDYNASLISVLSYVMSSFRSKASINEALGAAAQYASGPIAEDMKAILSAQATNLSREQTLREIAEKRDSLFLDGFFEAILSADKVSGADINKILADIQKATSEQVKVYLDHLVRIKQTATQVNWAVFGPWLIVGLARWLPLLLAGSTNGYADTDLSAFYQTPAGSLLLVFGAAASVYFFRYLSTGMRQGLILGRVRPGPEVSS